MSGLLLKLANLYAVLETLRLKTAEGENSLTAHPPIFGTLWIGEVLQKCFPAETPQRDWLAIRRAAADLADEIALARDEAERIPDVSFEIFLAALEDRLKRAETGAGRPGNTVVFSGMRQLRGLPYKVIVLWGLNEDSSFPGASHAEEFDLMKRFPRRSDRDSRTDNRNIFLDLLLAARSKFLISFTEGANPAQWKEPSVVAQELREYMAKLGIRTIDELVGRTDLLHVKSAPADSRMSKMDLDCILHNPAIVNSNVHFQKEDTYDFHLEDTLDMKVLMKKFKLSSKTPQSVKLDVSNTDRAFGAIFGSEITRKYGSDLPDDVYTSTAPVQAARASAHSFPRV